MPDTSYIDGLLQLTSLYRENKPLLFEMINKFQSPVSVLEETYRMLILSKEITPLEELPSEKKREIWDKSAGQANRIKWCKAYYVLEII